MCLPFNFNDETSMRGAQRVIDTQPNSAPSARLW